MMMIFLRVSFNHCEVSSLENLNEDGDCNSYGYASQVLVILKTHRSDKLHVRCLKEFLNEMEAHIDLQVLALPKYLNASSPCLHGMS